MVPSRLVFSDLATMLSQDPLTLAPAVLANKVTLSKSAFTPGPDLAIGGFTPSDFTGSTPISTILGNQNASIDPLTTQYQAEMKIPAGGWRWTVTALTNLPQQCFGVVMTDNAAAVVIASVLFAQPVTLDAVGQVVELDSIQFRFNYNAIN